MTFVLLVVFIVHINTNADLALTSPNNIGADVEVLGTHFNIKAYSDEKLIKTTLLEGSVKVTSQNKSVLIKPNQQANLVPGKDEIKVVDGVDVNATTDKILNNNKSICILLNYNADKSFIVNHCADVIC